MDQLLRGNVSECRNKTLQTMFMMIGGAEKAGSGVDKIRRGWESQHWRSPKVSEQVQPDRVHWMLPMVSLIPEESLSRLKALFAERFQRFSKLEVQALVTADVEGAVDNARMRQITGVHAADMTRMLQSLVAKHALTQEGQGRWTRYRLPARPDSLPSEFDSLNKAGHSLPSESDSLHKSIDSIPDGDALAPAIEALLQIAAPARRQKRLPTKEMERILLDLCHGKWLTRNQIADILDRNSESLRQRFLNPMVAHGLLRLRYPDKPNRTDQAYTAAAEEE